MNKSLQKTLFPLVTVPYEFNIPFTINCIHICQDIFKKENIEPDWIISGSGTYEYFCSTTEKFQFLYKTLKIVDFSSFEWKRNPSRKAPVFHHSKVEEERNPF